MKSNSELRSSPSTLRDVADAAGVSLGTASKALSGGYSLRDSTTQKVRLAADRLKFEPNQMAQSLQTGRTRTVGMLTSDLDGRFSLPILMGAEDAFGLGDVSILLCNARGDSVREQHHLRALMARRVDGLIIVGDTTNPRLSLGQKLPVPIVYAYAPSSDDSDVSLISDNITSGRIAAEHLLWLGRRRIAYLAGEQSFLASTDRVHGVTMVLRENGLDLAGGSALYGAWSEEWGSTAITSLLSVDPQIDGVLCGNDVIARGAVDALKSLGKSVPREVAVIGHDDIDLVATRSQPHLTTIDMNLEGLGREAAQSLFSAWSGTVSAGISSVPPRLILRASTIEGL